MNNYLILLIGLLLAVGLSRLIISKILIISMRKRLFDVPDARKVHKHPVSRLGGVSFFPTILFTVAFLLGLCGQGQWVNFILKSNGTEVLFFFCGLTLLFIVGIADDLIGVKYRQKFLVQFLAASLIPLAGWYISDFYGILGLHNIPSYIGIPLTVLLMVYITNAINLIDGIDGLASGLSIVALCVFGCLFAWGELWIYSLIAFVSMGVLLPFFFYNVFGNVDRGRKIFMGDTGSLTLGFILGYFTIEYIMNDVSGEGRFVHEGAMLLVFSILMIPCLDVIRVMLKRIRMKRHPFMPDKNHIHHKFLAMGMTPRRAMVSILCISLLFCICNILLVGKIDATLQLIGDVTAWMLMNLYINRVIAHKMVKR